MTSSGITMRAGGGEDEVGDPAGCFGPSVSRGVGSSRRGDAPSGGAAGGGGVDLGGGAGGGGVGFGSGAGGAGIGGGTTEPTPGPPPAPEPGPVSRGRSWLHRHGPAPSEQPMTRITAYRDRDRRPSHTEHPFWHMTRRRDGATSQVRAVSTPGARSTIHVKLDFVQTVMSYLLAIGGLVTVGVFVVGTFGANLKYMHARMMLVNLLRTNPYQVERVSATMQGTFFEAITAALKTGAMMGSRDPSVIAQATRPAYDAAAGAAATQWNTLLGKAKLATGAALAGSALPLATGKTPAIPVIIIGLVACAGLGWIYLRKMEIDASIIKARAEVLPEAERALIDGRYVAPPKQ